jgi:Raf kinase inhibitor-like YbhB/YbcL family protein
MMYRRPAIRATAAAFVSATAAVFAACGGGSSYRYAAAAPSSTPAAASTPVSSALTLTSNAFENNGTIPTMYTCAGAGTSPALAWSGAPAGTKAFVLTVHDPDAPLAGGFTHWIVTDLPAAAASLPAAVAAADVIAGGGTQAVAYRGMCPPTGAAAHHYHFRLYALDAPLGAAAGVSKDSIEAAMQGHILAQTDLVGLCGR